MEELAMLERRLQSFANPAHHPGQPGRCRHRAVAAGPVQATLCRGAGTVARRPAGCGGRDRDRRGAAGAADATEAARGGGPDLRSDGDSESGIRPGDDRCPPLADAGRHGRHPGFGRPGPVHRAARRHRALAAIERDRRCHGRRADRRGQPGARPPRRGGRHRPRARGAAGRGPAGPQPGSGGGGATGGGGGRADARAGWPWRGGWRPSSAPWWRPCPARREPWRPISGPSPAPRRIPRSAPPRSPEPPARRPTTCRPWRRRRSSSPPRSARSPGRWPRPRGVARQAVRGSPAHADATVASLNGGGQPDRRRGAA